MIMRSLICMVTGLALLGPAQAASTVLTLPLQEALQQPEVQASLKKYSHIRLHWDAPQGGSEIEENIKIGSYFSRKRTGNNSPEIACMNTFSEFISKILEDADRYDANAIDKITTFYQSSSLPGESASYICDVGGYFADITSKVRFLKVAPKPNPTP